MTNEEAKHKIEFLKKAYQKLIDEKVDSGKLVGDGVSGEWKAETPLDEAYKNIIEALDMAIKALEQQPSEDAIPRDKVLNMLADINTEMSDGEFFFEHWYSYIEKIPSVQPQPFINKPCISKGVCHEDKINVLKKIRAEIIELRTRQNVGVLECLDIIDEYIEEGEKDETDN